MRKPQIIGILNVTPDSFSDGGQFLGPDAALGQAIKMMEEDADWIDVGAESTRPGAQWVSPEEEWSRLAPILPALLKEGIPVSLDTQKAEIARRGLELGVRWINDVSALGDPQMLEVLREFKPMVCLMHRQGSPSTMQVAPRYDHVVEEVRKFLLERANWAMECGCEPQSIWLDPGIGFGKTVHHNLQLLQEIDKFTTLNYPIYVGVSRKRLIAELTTGTVESPGPGERLPGTLALQVWLHQAGVAALRVHDVAEAIQARAVVSALLQHSPLG